MASDHGRLGAAPHRPEAPDARAVPTSPASPQYRPRPRRSMRFERDDGGPAVLVTGKTARTLRRLILAGEAGATTADLLSIGGRPAAYVAALRRRGLTVTMARETGADGWSGRYRLATPVRLAGAWGG